MNSMWQSSLTEIKTTQCFGWLNNTYLPSRSILDGFVFAFLRLSQFLGLFRRVNFCPDDMLSERSRIIITHYKHVWRKIWSGKENWEKGLRDTLLYFRGPKWWNYEVENDGLSVVIFRILQDIIWSLLGVHILTLLNLQYSFLVSVSATWWSYIGKLSVTKTSLI